MKRYYEIHHHEDDDLLEVFELDKDGNLLSVATPTIDEYQANLDEMYGPTQTI